MISIDIPHLEIVLSVLKKYVPGYKVRAFGSRVGKCHKKYSDLDLVIMNEEPLPVKTLALMRDAFSETDLPFKVDVIEWAKTSADFQKIIEERFEIIKK